VIGNFHSIIHRQHSVSRQGIRDEEGTEGGVGREEEEREGIGPEEEHSLVLVNLCSRVNLQITNFASAKRQDIHKSINNKILSRQRDGPGAFGPGPPDCS
jgi:hypothetical protein